MPKVHEWRGSVFRPAGKNFLYLKVKGCSGRWQKIATPYRPGEEALAEKMLGELRDRLLAQAALLEGELRGPITVRAWSQRWLRTRAASRKDDESILRNHVLPAIGDDLLADVQPRHILAMVESWRRLDQDGNPVQGAPAPRTVGNWYGVARAMFRDAAIRGVIPNTPCILTTPYLPTREDADSEWRASARFSREELERLISPNRAIEEDSRMVYALLGLAALRHGEMAALRWRHVVQREPLNGLLIANSGRRRRTKKGKTRMMPIHPLLAAMLAEWRLHGWARLIGRAPGENDLVMPLPAVPRTGRRPSRAALIEGDQRMRGKENTRKRCVRHLKALGVRHRRVHDLRRTFVGLATAAGSDDRILYWGTHGRPGDIMGAYGDADWRRLCEEVSRLQVELRAEVAPVVALVPTWSPPQGSAAAQAK